RLGRQPPLSADPPLVSALNGLLLPAKFRLIRPAETPAFAGDRFIGAGGEPLRSISGTAAPRICRRRASERAARAASWGTMAASCRITPLLAVPEHHGRREWNVAQRHCMVIKS